MRLNYLNSLTFNGEQSDFTHKVKTHLNVVEETLIPFAEHCESLEENIRKAQKRAIEQADLDSLGTSEEQEPRQATYAEKILGPLLLLLLCCCGCPI